MWGVMGAQRTSLRQLSAALGLSNATVSRALTGHPSVAPDTRVRVTEKAAELGYVPNVAGRMLVSGRSGFAGLVVPVRGANLMDAFLGEFVTGLGAGLSAHGSDLLIATVTEKQKELNVLKRLVESGRVDGLVINRTAERDDRIDYLRAANFPFVSHGRVLEPDRNLHWLDTDGAAAFGEAFDMLYALGHRRFGLLTIEDPMTFRYYREAGLRNAISKRGDPDVSLVVQSASRFDCEGVKRATERLLSCDARPTAVIGLIDDLALEVLATAQRLGLSVPKDLSVVGFDNVAAAAFVRPGLTTFDQDIRASATHLSEMLITIIKDRPDEPLTHLIRPKLVARASHGPAPA